MVQIFGAYGFCEYIGYILSEENLNTVWIDYSRTTLSKVQYIRAYSIYHYLKYIALHLMVINIFFCFTRYENSQAAFLELKSKAIQEISLH